MKLKFQISQSHEQKQSGSGDSQGEEKEEPKIVGQFGPNAELVCKEKRDKCEHEETPVSCTNAGSCASQNESNAAAGKNYLILCFLPALL